MTTTSALSFQAMEVPTVEDSMEMASPYQGQVDDFDIDIDLMEDPDHASNMDSDMVGAEDFPNTSQPSLFNDANNDADMADEPSEGSMVDADTFADEDHDIEVQDEDVTYEADMLEGDQDEEIVEAVPTIQIEDAANKNNEPAQIDQVQQNVIEPTEDTIGLAQQAPDSHPVPAALTAEETQELQPEPEPQPGPELGSEQPDQTISLEPKSTDQDQAEKADTNQTVSTSGNDEQTKLDEGTNSVIEDKTVTPTAQSTHLEAAIAENVEAPQAAGVQPAPPAAVDDDTDHLEHQDAKHVQTHDNGPHGSNEDESLHPVKVLYQDTEISLFPPLEGDSAETFFLHDEDVAYDNVGKLFSSLREVLLDNVADDEVLVIDIDSLGIQLTEDSTHNSKITLHHILDIYVRLSRNDGINEPDAMYLTLGSKISAHSELAGLDSAANEGKGMSQVHAWDVDYEDGGNEDVTEHEANQQEDSLASKKEIEKHQEADEASHVQSTAADDAKEAEDSAEAHGDFVTNAEADTGHAENEYQQEENVAAESTHGTEDHQPYHEDQTTRQESLEASKIESSDNTNPAQEPTVGLEDDAADENEATWAHPEEADQADYAPTGQDSHETATAEAADDHDHDQHSGDYQDEAAHNQAEAPETVVDTDAIDLTSAHVDSRVDEPHAGIEDQEEEIGQGEDRESLGESESTVKNAPQEEVAELEEHNLDPEDDLLGIAEDVLQTEDNYDDEPDNFEDDLATPPGEEGETHEHHTGEDEEEDLYADLETSETIELGETDHSPADSQERENTSTKRSREEEDEWDLVETNPELKRRRPS